MRKLGLSARAMLLASNILAFSLPAAAEANLTVVTFGGAFENAVDKAFFGPFTAATGTQVTKEQYDGGLAKLRGMVESGNTTWDVIDLESNDAIAGCDEGLLQKLNPKLLGDTSDFIPGAVLPCAVASMVWSTVFAYDTSRMATAPASMADFFDTGKFPGKRGLRKNPKGALEWALIADGVAVSDVYKTLGTTEGLDRAFKKLSTIKSDIVWWDAGSQAPQLLADGAVAMTMAYNGRIRVAQVEDKRSFAIVWDGQVYDYEWWAIPKGAKKASSAEQFIEYASNPENIWKLSNFIPYAPPRKSVMESVDKAVLSHLPTASDNFRNALQLDSEFWADNFDSINSRFMTWLAQ
ncbi:ABC transporter substrate-binding protein [Ensifer sp. YR511]|uniref:ABC transporter substrate-binding protein n=1 Tax=Ensifer sp. YR511 TaxID=1855294 RepID=UPI000888CE22|nr:ABC transporter substrate-binding protein [Ensifer sp. YR511]SDN70840.1 putative spermidine/putrescine transport system substrate-binding protein [Ensifer sp. YR511]